MSIEEYKIEGKLILHVYIPESSQVHKCNGKIFDRNQDGDLDISNSTDLVANMYIRKQKGFSENEIFPYASLEHLKVELIDKVRKMAVIRNADHPWKDMNNEELLRSAGLIQNDFKTGKQGLTIGCILLFGKDETINSVAPQHRTDAILRQINLDRYDDRDDIRCNLILQLLSYMAEDERKRIKDRQKDGIRLALNKGIKFGRRKIEINEDFEPVYKKWKNGEFTAVSAMKMLDMKSNTFYRRVKEYETYNR